MSDSEDTVGYDSERYLEEDEFMEAASFVEETGTTKRSPNPKCMQRSKLMSTAIRQRVNQQQQMFCMPQKTDAHTQTISEINVQRLSYVAIFVACLITLCVLGFVLKEPCNCTCTINI